VSNRQQRRMSGVPQRAVIHQGYRNESEDDDQDTGYRVIKVVDLVMGASFWSAVMAVMSIWYEEVSLTDILNPIAFMVMFLLLVPIKKVDI
jgi:hypothetical protein